MADTNIYNPSVGLFYNGIISPKGYNSSTGKVSVQLYDDKNKNTVDVYLPTSLFNNNGLFIGTVPSPGTPVTLGKLPGGQPSPKVRITTKVLAYQPRTNQLTVLLNQTAVCLNRKKQLGDPCY